MLKHVKYRIIANSLRLQSWKKAYIALIFWCILLYFRLIWTIYVAIWNVPSLNYFELAELLYRFTVFLQQVGYVQKCVICMCVSYFMENLYLFNKLLLNKLCKCLLNSSFARQIIIGFIYSSSLSLISRFSIQVIT